MTSYRKRPIVVEAVQYESSMWQLRQQYRWIDDAYQRDRITLTDGYWWAIRTPEGVMQIRPGDWIVQGAFGELYPVKPDIFAATYEPVEEVTA